MGLAIGSQRFTADGAIGTSGSNVRVYEVIVRAASSATAVNLRNGTSASATIFDTVDASASTTTRVIYAGGLQLVGGGYVDVDANTSFVTVIYEQENS